MSPDKLQPCSAWRKKNSTLLVSSFSNVFRINLSWSYQQTCLSILLVNQSYFCNDSLTLRWKRTFSLKANWIPQQKGGKTNRIASVWTSPVPQKLGGKQKTDEVWYQTNSFHLTVERHLIFFFFHPGNKKFSLLQTRSNWLENFKSRTLQIVVLGCKCDCFVALLDELVPVRVVWPIEIWLRPFWLRRNRLGPFCLRRHDAIISIFHFFLVVLGNYDSSVIWNGIVPFGCQHNLGCSLNVNQRRHFQQGWCVSDEGRAEFLHCWPVFLLHSITSIFWPGSTPGRVSSLVTCVSCNVTTHWTRDSQFAPRLGPTATRAQCTARGTQWAAFWTQWLVRRAARTWIRFTSHWFNTSDPVEHFLPFQRRDLVYRLPLPLLPGWIKSINFRTEVVLPVSLWQRVCVTEDWTSKQGRVQGERTKVVLFKSPPCPGWHVTSDLPLLHPNGSREVKVPGTQLRLGANDWWWRWRRSVCFSTLVWLLLTDIPSFIHNPNFYFNRSWLHIGLRLVFLHIGLRNEVAQPGAQRSSAHGCHLDNRNKAELNSSERGGALVGDVHVAIRLEKKSVQFVSPMSFPFLSMLTISVLEEEVYIYCVHTGAVLV